MKIRLVSLLAVSGLLVGASAMGAPFAGASTGPRAVRTGGAGTVAPLPPGITVLWDQTSGDSGVAIVSQDFTDPGFDIYDSQGADDFVVPAGGWHIKAIQVIGVYFNGPGPSTSQHLFVYADSGGLPGAQLGTATLMGSMGPSFTYIFPGAGKHLNAGHYWLSVQPVLEFACCGEWGWETRNPTQGQPSAWQNPLNGFGTGCTTWGVQVNCIGAFGQGTDFMFRLGGSAP